MTRATRSTPIARFTHSTDGWWRTAEMGRKAKHAVPAMIAVLSGAVLFAGMQQPAAAPSIQADELVGLWKARRRFGPDARGPLVIQRTGATYTADMMGRVVPVRVERNELFFELPNGQGRFRGRLQAGGTIHGAWIPPGSVAMGGHASPVHFKADGPNRWVGTVAPFDDVFTFYLMVRRRPDGAFGAVLRNPERDFGAWLGVERLVREGNVVKLMGRRAGQTRERAVISGSYNDEDTVLTLVFPSRGGSYDFRRDGDDSEFYPRGKSPGRYVYRPPPARDDGWPTGTLDQAGMDRAALERLIQTILDMPMDGVDTAQVHGLLIARHGRLVLEEYFHGEHRDKLHETRSASKSLTATIVGAAMHAGAPLTLSTPVYQIMNGGAFSAGLDTLKRSMTLEHLLTMSSGFFCDDANPDAPGNEQTLENQTDDPDFHRYTMAVPMAFAPGDTAIYCSANANLALGVTGRATGEWPLYTFERLLGSPLKIRHYGWRLDPAGSPYGGGGVQFLPRDFMKLGQLMLDGGTWEGRRILSRDFVARASAPLYPLGSRRYGYLWWTIAYPYRDRTMQTFAALGAGGQVVVVVPELDLVIASYGANYSSRGYRWVSNEVIPRFILPAIR
jgi:CubicO group peptidase (beta-lactamase class C family)